MKELRILISVCLLAQQLFVPVSAVFAQGAPAGDNDFAQDMQGGSSDEGGPILDQPPQSKQQTQAPSEPGDDNAPPRSMPQAQTPGSPIAASRVGGAPQKDAPMYEEAEAISPLDRKIGPIRLKGAPLSTFLDVVSAQSKVNFIITEGLEAKTITVFLRKTTVREALELLLRVKGLTYQRIGKSNTYVVQTRSADMPNLITKIYVLNYVPLIPITTVGEDLAAVTSQDVSSNASGSEGGQRGSAQAEASSGVAIIDIIRSVLSKKSGKLTGGQIATDPRTNTLIVTDVPEVFPQVEQIIAELDKKAPQILIEAQIVEINTDRMNELGIEWGGSRGEMAYFAGPSRLTDYGLRPGFFSGDSWKNLFPTDYATSGEAAAAAAPSGVDPIFSSKVQSPKGVFYGVFSLAQLQATFRALVSRGEARYLGKPKIVAMNNKTAIISTSRDAAVGTSAQTSSAGGATGSSTTGAERRRIGLTLRVTPQVNKEGYITLVVQPSYSDIIASAITVNGSTVYDPVSRGASTMVRVKNGQTVVIGGMLSSTETKTVRKVPLFGYIPIIGWLFTSVSSRRSNTDMVIFLTPTILVD